jgi:phthalate 4,5-dioxygenase
MPERDDEALTQVGPGTLVGELLRQYWLPALLVSELPARDGHPVRVLLLGEQLIAFRETSGRVGLLANHCPHRGASLFFGRIESQGLRCSYHGWKFDVDGRCLDRPNEPPEANLDTNIRTTAYPCLEQGGIIWAYLGPNSAPPPFPQLEAAFLAEDERELAAYYRDCNWLQALEGDIDSSHVGLLHFGGLRPDDVPGASFKRHTVLDRAPRLEVADTDAGAMYCAIRALVPGLLDCRIVQFVFPCYVMLEAGLLGDEIGLRAWAPMDDHHTMFFGINRTGPASKRTHTTTQRSGFELLPNESGWLGRHRLAANASNDYLIDRDRQREGDFTGVAGIFTQDAAVTESMGAIVDRHKEHLGTGDRMIIRVRQRLLDAARRLREDEVPPPGVLTPKAYTVRSGGVFLPNGLDWIDETAELRRAP